MSADIFLVCTKPYVDLAAAPTQVPWTKPDANAGRYDKTGLEKAGEQTAGSKQSGMEDENDHDDDDGAAGCVVAREKSASETRIHEKRRDEGHVTSVPAKRPVVCSLALTNSSKKDEDDGGTGSGSGDNGREVRNEKEEDEVIWGSLWWKMGHIQ